MIKEGNWQHIDHLIVDVPASLGFENGVWLTVRQGLRGLLVPDERRLAVSYLICEPASHYYRVMTKSSRMPVLIDQ